MYHDLGNINCTFFTKRSQYERRRNLDLICSALRRTTALDVSVNEREDIVLDGAHKGCGIQITKLAHMGLMGYGMCYCYRWVSKS